MGFKCYFCEERDRVSYFSNWCSECANLRRMLLIYSPDKCCGILKRTLTRDEKQIDYKISQEQKALVNKEIENIDDTDESYIKKPETRSSKKKT
jgi:hypothetical protein|tara:strand:+ start:266 stop:547 length:282 start_codon:yes stop_codon:yes gene_type:complete